MTAKSVFYASLGPELNLLRAGDANTLADAEIEIPCRRIAQHVPRLNAERAGGHGAFRCLGRLGCRFA